MLTAPGPARGLANRDYSPPGRCPLSIRDAPSASLYPPIIATTDPQTAEPTPRAVVISVLLSGLLASVVISGATGAWGSTRAGNTALVVPFASAPLILTIGWTVLLARLRHLIPSGPRLSIGLIFQTVAALVTSLLTVRSPVMVVNAGGSSEIVPWAVALPPLLAAFAAIASASRLLGEVSRITLISAFGTAIAAIVLSFLPTGLGATVAPFSVPFILVAPLVAGPAKTEANDRWLITGSAGLPILMVGAFLLVQIGLAFRG